MSAIASTAQRVSKKTVSLANRLARLRNGPASFAVPAELKELEMTFSLRNKDYGARKFYKNDLPSICYMNPNLAVNVNRPETADKPVMLLKYNDGTTKSIQLKAKSDELIREELKEVLKGTLPASISEPIFVTGSSSAASSSTSPKPAEKMSKQPAATTTKKQQSASPASPPTTTPPPPPKGEVESAVDVGTARQ